jgi:hypothetical protein
MCRLYKKDGVGYHRGRINSSLMAQKGGSSGFISSIPLSSGMERDLGRRTTCQKLSSILKSSMAQSLQD